MQATSMPRVKICCIASAEEAQRAVEQGAAALGFVSKMPSGPGTVPDELIAEVVARVPPGVATFLLTSEIHIDAIVAQQHKTRVNTLQLVDSLPPGAHRELRGALPGISLVQVIHVMDEASIEVAASIAPDVDAILLDSGNPNLVVKELGGTGRVHDWALSLRIREKIDRPLFLAGGLRADNVSQAIRRVGPFGLDVCSGVRTNGRLDTTKLAEFFRAVARHSGDGQPKSEDYSLPRNA
jgi:phosphoribosylanthranilate isomerase